MELEDLHSTSAMPSKVKGQGRKAMCYVWQALANKLRTKRPINTKICKKVAHSVYNKALQFQGQKVKVTRPINAEVKSVLYRTKVKTYGLQTW